MKRILLILSIILIVTLFWGSKTAPAFANDTKPTFSVSCETVTPGEEVTVAVSFNSNPGVRGITLELQADSRLELVNVEDTGLMRGFFSEHDYDKKPYILGWDDSLSITENISDGVIAYLTFQVPQDAVPDNYSVVVNVKEVYNLVYNEEDRQLDFVNISCKTVSGGITVVDVMKGDFDGNGSVTDDDAIHLLYYTFFPDKYPINQSGDFDGDGRVTDSDAIYLLYYTFFPDKYPIW